MHSVNDHIYITYYLGTVLSTNIINYRSHKKYTCSFSSIQKLFPRASRCPRILFFFIFSIFLRNSPVYNTCTGDTLWHELQCLFFIRSWFGTRQSRVDIFVISRWSLVNSYYFFIYSPVTQICTIRWQTRLCMYICIYMYKCIVGPRRILPLRCTVNPACTIK